MTGGLSQTACRSGNGLASCAAMARNSVFRKGARVSRPDARPSLGCATSGRRSLHARIQTSGSNCCRMYSAIEPNMRMPKIAIVLLLVPVTPLVGVDEA